MTRNTKLTLHVRSSCCSKCVTARILLIMVAWTVVMDLFFFKIIFWGFLPLFDRKQGQRDGCDMQRRSPLGSNQGRCNYVACALTIWLLGRYVGMNHYVVWVQWINSCKQMKKKKNYTNYMPLHWRFTVWTMTASVIGDAAFSMSVRCMVGVHLVLTICKSRRKCKRQK